MHSHVFRPGPSRAASRALVWGTILAAWGTSAVVIRSAKAMGISSLSDVRDKCNDVMYPVAERIYHKFEPVREKARPHTLVSAELG